MKKSLKITGWILASLVLLLVVVIFFLDRVVLHGFNTGAPLALGVPAHLDDARVRLLRGYTSLRGLHIGNPEGFNTDSLFELDEVTIRLDRGSLFTDTIVIKEIIIKDAELTYEQGLLQNNIGALLESLAKVDDAEKDDDAEKKDDDKPGKKIIIEKLDITGTRMNVTITAAMSHVIPIPLPPIHMTDIGKESEGASVGEVIHSVFSAIGDAATSAVAASAQLLGDGAAAIGQGAMAAGGAVADGAIAAGSAVTDGAIAAGGAVADGAQAVGGAVAEGAQAVGGAVAEGASALGHALNPFD